MKKKLLISLDEKEIPSHKAKGFRSRQAILSTYITLGEYMADRDGLKAKDLQNLKSICHDIDFISNGLKSGSFTKQDDTYLIERATLAHNKLQYTPREFIKLWNSLNNSSPKLKSFTTGITNSKEAILISFKK